MQAPRTRVIYLRISEEDHARLQMLAQRQDRKMAQVIARVLRDHLREQFGEYDLAPAARPAAEAVPA